MVAIRKQGADPSRRTQDAAIVRSRYLEEWLADLATFSDRPIAGVIFTLQVWWSARGTAKSLLGVEDAVDPQVEAATAGRTAFRQQGTSSNRPQIPSRPSMLAIAERVSRRKTTLTIEEVQAIRSGILRDPRNWLTPIGLITRIYDWALMFALVVIIRVAYVIGLPLMAHEIAHRPRGRQLAQLYQCTPRKIAFKLLATVVLRMSRTLDTRIDYIAIPLAKRLRDERIHITATSAARHASITAAKR